ncbi:MAG: 2-amino-5-chloromuconate deaminase CnbZ [Burkholderiales bacterium]
MSAPIPFAHGGFAFLEGAFPYSQGVVALAGLAIERARFARPVPMVEGFRRIAAHLAALGRPGTALCACELRSSKPFSFAGFGEFNIGYVAVLEDWGLYRDGLNPVARSNVAPEIDPPAEPCFYAFSYTVPSGDAGPSFVVAGSGEWPEGGRFPEDIVARADHSESGMRTKANWVLDTMESRMRGLGGFTWRDATAVQVYTAHRFPVDEVARRAGPSLTWHYCRPPIEGLEFEMDVRGVATEHTLPDFP